MTLQFKKTFFPFFGRGKIAFDCHYHSQYSDGHAKIDTILQKAKEYNMGIAITDHNDIRGSVKAYNNTLGVSVIPGIEISCKGMIHLLIYFYTIQDLKDFYNSYVEPYKRVDPNTSLKKMTALKIAKLAKQYHCIVALAHPYSMAQRGIESYVKKERNKDFFSYIDCIEVLNGTKRKKTNQKAFALAKKLKKPMIGGSDGHTIKALGDVLMVCEKGDIAHFLDMIKKDAVTIVGKKSSMYQIYKSAGIISLKHIHATTKKHQAAIATSLGLYVVLQRFLIPVLFLTGSIAYKKIREKRRR